VIGFPSAQDAAELILRSNLPRLREYNHYQVLIAIIVGVKGDFFGQRLAGIIEELDPKFLRRSNGMIPQDKFKARRPVRRNIPAQHHAVDEFVI
jgi:hypothetical protein